jgi:hypothetical protein
MQGPGLPRRRNTLPGCEPALAHWLTGSLASFPQIH